VNAASDDAVRITVPARAEFLHVVRTVVGSVAARNDLTIDAIEDLRIAVDEACAQLLTVRGSSITVEIAPSGEGVETLCTTDADVAELVSTPTSGRAVTVSEGFYTMPFRITVVR